MVDDFIFMHEKEQTWTNFIQQVCKRFNVPVFGPLIGMTITYSAPTRRMTIVQTNTIKTLLERADMTDCNPVPTPCVNNIVWTKEDCPKTPDQPDKVTKYRALIALANFIACWTRPDITYTVNKLCKFMSNPGVVHWQALKHLLRS